jgi:hypothetical protein
MQKIQDFIKDYPIAISSQQIENRPSNDAGDGFHWLVTLTYETRTMIVFYTMGYGHCTFKPDVASFDSRREAEKLKGNSYMYPWDKVKDICEFYGIKILPKQPLLEDVLYSLQLDCAGVEFATDFDDWCSQYGFDTDSRKAERSYHAILQERRDLLHLIGLKAYETLLQVEEA